MAVDTGRQTEAKAQALETLRSGALAEARILYEQICRTDPQDADAWHMLTTVNGMLGRFPAAETCARRVIELVPTADGAYSNLGNALLAQNRTDEARQCFEQALALRPGNPEAHNNLGVLCQRRGEHEAAAQHFQQALATNSSHAEACNNLGTALHALGRWQDALNCFTHTLKLNPHYAGAHFGAGKVLQDQGRLQEALPCLQQTLALQSGHIPARLALAHVFASMGSYADALNQYQQIVDRTPDAGAYLGMAKIYNDTRQFQQSIEICRQALAHYPDDVALQLALARAQRGSGAIDTAIETLRGALRLDPRNAQILHTLAALGDRPTPARASAQYVAELFDDYADRFDRHLVDVLDYHIPEILHRTIASIVGADFQNWDILDLGCGTGLCAPLFRGHARRLAGVDLSSKMVDKARERSLYDDLYVDDLLNTLTSATGTYDLILATDVFVYIGDLTQVFQASRDCLRPDGLFAFSTETLQEDGSYRLHEGGRYAHGVSYLLDQAARAGFAVLSNQPAMIRKEQNRPVAGHITVLRKTGIC